MTLQNTLNNLEIELRKINENLVKTDEKLKEIKQELQLNPVAKE